MTDQETLVSQVTSIDAPERFVQARELRGMSKGEAAQRLKLAPRQLDALERGDWAALPGRAFVRGAIRSYGRLLETDVAPLLQAVGGFAESENLRPTATLAAPMPRAGAFGFAGEGRGHLLTWLLLAVTVVVALGLFFGRGDDTTSVRSWIGGDPARPQAVPAAPSSSSSPPGASLVLPTLQQPVLASAEPTASSVPGAPGATGAGAAAGAGVPGNTGSGAATGGSGTGTGTAGAGAPMSGASSPPGQGPSGAGTAGAPTAAPPSPPVVAASSGTAGAQGAPGAQGTAGAPGTAAQGAAASASAGADSRLRLVVAQEAWVEVRQGDGKVLFSGTVKPGAPADFPADGPLSLVIGNASQVKLEHHGRAVELKPAANNIARVKLP